MVAREWTEKQKWSMARYLSKAYPSNLFLSPGSSTITISVRPSNYPSINREILGMTNSISWRSKFPHVSLLGDTSCQSPDTTMSVSPDSTMRETREGEKRGAHNFTVSTLGTVLKVLDMGYQHILDK